MIRIHIFTILFTLSLTASQITVAVAANVGYAISDLKKAFLKIIRKPISESYSEAAGN
jgi:hypothetical protein